MTLLYDRLSLSAEDRVKWLMENDLFLFNELKKKFGDKLYLRNQDYKGYPAQMAKKHFTYNPELDYFIYSTHAATYSGFKFVKSSRIGYYRPSKNYGASYFRAAAFRFVWLKKQILSIFDEDFLVKTRG